MEIRLQTVQVDSAIVPFPAYGAFMVCTMMFSQNTQLYMHIVSFCDCVAYAFQNDAERTVCVSVRSSGGESRCVLTRWHTYVLSCTRTNTYTR